MAIRITDKTNEELLKIYDTGKIIGKTIPSSKTKGYWYEVVLTTDHKLITYVLDCNDIYPCTCEEITIDELPLYVDDIQAAKSMIG